MLIRGLPVERYGKARASAIYWGVGMHLGQPWPQNAKGHLLGDVTDQGQAIDDPTSRGNEIGGIAFPFHSDGSDLVGLFCLDAGRERRREPRRERGDDPQRARAHRARARGRALRAVRRTTSAASRRPGAKPWYTMPVFTRRGDRLFVRYIRPYIESARRHDDAPRPSDAAREAMDRVDAMCADPEYHVSMTMQPGDMQFVNNYHVLHARDAYTDDRAGRAGSAT